MFESQKGLFIFYKMLEAYITMRCLFTNVYVLNYIN